MGGEDFGIFDGERPPSVKLADDCVHCGFCLPTCPTYVLWGEEMDSPRGRIHLVKLGLEGEVKLDETYLQHFDRCLGCAACVTACPSGVQYEPLLEATKAQLERHAPRSLADRAFRAVLLTLFPNRAVLRVLAVLGWLYRLLGGPAVLRGLGIHARLPARLQALEGLLPDVHLADAVASLPAKTDATGEPRMKVGLLQGCVQSVFFRGANEATLEVLAAEGIEIHVPDDAGCCGALASHQGADETARAQARDIIEAFEERGLDRVVVNAAGCGSHLKHLGRLLADDPYWAARAKRLADKVVDVLELLDELPAQALRGPLAETVAYHDACHLAHAQGIRDAPRRVLAAIPNLEVVEIQEAAICCGSAGVYNLTQPEAAAELGKRKADHIRATGANVVAAGNPGCLLQIGKHLPEVEVVHPIELLARSIERGD